MSNPPCLVLQEETHTQSRVILPQSHTAINILLVGQDSSVRVQYLSWSTAPLFCFHTEDLRSQKGKGNVPGFLEAGGSFKAGPCYCQPDLVSMEAASGAACSYQPGSWEGGPNAPWSLSLPTSSGAV